jgi:hypothetical protein
VRVLIASANPWSFALAVERQMARKHQDDDVDLLDLWSLSGRFSPHWSPRDRMIERANRKIERFIKPVINGRDISRSVTPRAPVPDSPGDVTDLRHYRVDGLPVGLAVLSSVFELTSIQDARFASEYGNAFDEAWHSAHRSLQIGQAVEQLGYDRVYIFGGRHCYSRPFIDAVSRKSEVLRYEQGGTGTSYVMAAESLYEPLNLAKLIASYPLDEAAGERWFKERLSRSAAWDAGFFTGSQDRGRIPEALGDRPFVTFFNTSVDEFYAIRDEVRFGDYATQGDAALAMARICRDEGKGFAVRFHPHLKFKHPSWRNEWNTHALKELGAILVEPDDPTDTYALAQASESVLSCGSTISFECSFLAKANAVLGDGLAGGMGAAPIVRTEDDLRQFIRAPHLPADARRNALKLGSFYKNGATPVEGLDPGSHPNFARIDGRIVDPVRYALQRVRETVAGLSGKKAENRSGIVEGRVALPSGARYRTR